MVLCYGITRKLIRPPTVVFTFSSTSLLLPTHLPQPQARVLSHVTHGLQAARFLCPWIFPGKNTGVGCYFLLHVFFLNLRNRGLGFILSFIFIYLLGCVKS